MKGSGVMRIKIMASLMLKAVKANNKSLAGKIRKSVDPYTNNVVKNYGKKSVRGIYKKGELDITTSQKQCSPSNQNITIRVGAVHKVERISKRTIEQKIREIFREFGIKCYENITALATLIGFKVGESDNIDDYDDGFIYISEDKGKKVIGVNSNRSLKQKRFIVAHELGHYFLHYNENNNSLFAFRENRKGKDFRENEADYFAACLLMPADIFSQKYISLKKSKMRYSEQEIIDELSDIFCVTNESVIRRIKEVDCDCYA